MDQLIKQLQMAAAAQAQVQGPHPHAASALQLYAAAAAVNLRVPGWSPFLSPCPIRGHPQPRPDAAHPPSTCCVRWPSCNEPMPPPQQPRCEIESSQEIGISRRIKGGNRERQGTDVDSICTRVSRAKTFNTLRFILVSTR